MIRRVKDIFMYQTAGELKAALDKIPDDTLLVRTVFKIKIVLAHVSHHGFFIGFHDNTLECKWCKIESKIESVLTID